jgi:hypothetical protein
VTSLFGPNRDRIGYEEHPWSVWVLGMDDIHDRPTLDECLALAQEFNASFAHLWMASNSEFDPVMYAVVLHHGYAWSRTAGPVCGAAGCQPCAVKEATK